MNETTDFLGKYYNDNCLSAEEREDLLENKKLYQLECLWNEKSEFLDSYIDMIESDYEKEQDTIKKSDILKTLKDLYEKRKVSNDYKGRFVSTNNLPLLEALYNNGKFVNINDAQNLCKEYDDKIYFSSNLYKNKEKKFKILSVILGLLSAFIFVPTFYGFVSGGISFIKEPIPCLAISFAAGWGVMAVCSIVLIPVNMFLSFFIVPKILQKIIFKNKYSEDLKKYCNTAASMAIGAGVAAGISTHAHLKKSGEVKFKDN